MAAPTPENLERLAGLLEAGTVTIHIQERHALAEAGEALQALGMAHTQGKLAIAVA
jgi:NADPH:quinone reductase-like Zn-dependent oxidoreductase